MIKKRLPSNQFYFWLSIINVIAVSMLVLDIYFSYCHFSRQLTGAFLVIPVIMFTVSTVLLIRRSFQLKKAITLCSRFTKGDIYNEFIDQIGYVDQNLDDAVHRLDDLINRQKTIELSTTQAEYLALQNQINPHFLYNTLEAIRGDALSIGAEGIANTTEALSTFFRYTITNTRNLVTLQEELDNVETYFMIQKYRFGDKLTLEIRYHDSPDQLANMHCPKLTLQPVIENAIFHGLEKNKDKGKISIDIGIVDDTMRIEISDNGKGMDESQLLSLNNQLSRASIGYVIDNEQSRKNGGIALKNVNRRIMLLFGEEYGLRIHSIPHMGTKVDIILPLERKGSLPS